MQKFSSLALSVAMWSVGCGGSDAPGTAATGGDTATSTGAVTYHKDVEPILQAHCQICHQDGGIAPFALTKYEEVKPLAGLIKLTVASRKMPPFGAHDSDDCSVRFGFKDDNRLSQAQIDALAAWSEDGAPEGDVKDAPPAKDQKPWALSRVDQTLKPATDYIADGKGDLFMCFVLDPKLAERTFVNGVNFLPGNAKVVHHALLFLDTDRESATLAGGTDRYECFGGPGLKSTQLIGAWAPGIRPLELPENAGMELPADSLFVVQIHYHPTGEGPEPDATAVQLKLDTKEPEYFSVAALIGNFDGPQPGGNGLLPGQGDAPTGPIFKIPAGSSGHQEHMKFTLPFELDGNLLDTYSIWATAAHMHWAGKNMKIEVERRDASVAYCPPDTFNPFLACYSAKCATAADAAKCTDEFCKDVYDVMPDICRNCLAGYVTAGNDAATTIAACTKVSAPASPQPASECLLETPKYDFSWQRFYTYDAPIEELPTIGPGDVLKFSCTYDNSMENPYVVESLEYKGLSTPVDVVLGETTLDEMCLVGLQILWKPVKK